MTSIAKGASYIALLGLTAGLAWPALAADETPVRGGTLIVTLGGDPPTVNPNVSSGVPDGIIGCAVHQGLTEISAKGLPKPMLAKSWTISPDGKTYTFELNKAVFHDGKPMTSADVKYSLMEVSAKLSPQFASAGRMIEDVDTSDPYRAVVKLKNAYGPLLLQLACGMGAAILPKHVFEGTNVLQNPATTSKPIGTGAFAFQEWKRGDHIRLARNTDYWEPGKPYLDGVVAKIIAQAPARTQALQAGEVDFVSYYYFPSSDQKTAMADPKLSVTPGVTAPSLDYLFLNVLNKPLDDKRVRQALLIATDREYLLKNGWLGMGNVGVSPFTSALAWTVNPEVDYRKMYPFDTAKANALLDEAGYKRGADGNRFSLRAVYVNDEVDFTQVIQALKSMWRAVGVDVIIDAAERATALKRVYIDHDFDLHINGYTSYGDPAIGLARSFVTSSIGKPYANASSYSNPAVDDLFQKGETAPSQDARAAIYREVQALLAQEVPVYTLREKQLSDVQSVRLQWDHDEMFFISWRNAWLKK